MKLSALLLILLLSVAAGAVAYLLVYFYVPRESPGMGRGVGPQLYVWIPIIVAPATFIIGLVAYLALLPEFKEKLPAETVLPEEQKSLVAVMKVLRDDERKVIELLISAGGKMLQRDIGRKAGFSRVKTHRVLYRLSTRGIVNAKKYYNTYEIELADWLR
jgi:uncharacterized membrane protein